MAQKQHGKLTVQHKTSDKKRTIAASLLDAFVHRGYELVIEPVGVDLPKKEKSKKEKSETPESFGNKPETV